MFTVGERERRRFSDVLARTESIDLSMVCLKLIHPNIGNGWDPDWTHRIEYEYRRYFALQVAFEDLWLPPSRVLDEFWHNHILDTRAYAADCETVAGRMVHHFPYFGMRGPEDPATLVAAFMAEADLYRECFGTEPPSDIWITDLTVAQVERLVAGQYANPAAASAARLIDGWEPE